MYGLVVYVKQGLPFKRNLCLEISADSYVQDWFYFTRSYFFFLYLFLFLLCMVFYPISSNIDETLLINLYGRISLNLVLLLLLVNFVSGFRLELIYISQIVNIRSSLSQGRAYIIKNVLYSASIYFLRSRKMFSIIILQKILISFTNILMFLFFFFFREISISLLSMLSQDLKNL